MVAGACNPSELFSPTLPLPDGSRSGLNQLFIPLGTSRLRGQSSYIYIHKVPISCELEVLSYSDGAAEKFIASSPRTPRCSTPSL